MGIEDKIDSLESLFESAERYALTLFKKKVVYITREELENSSDYVVNDAWMESYDHCHSFPVWEVYDKLLLKFGFPNEDNFWLWREHIRGASIYDPILLSTTYDLYENEKIDSDKLSDLTPDKFLHVSEKQKGLVAFTENPEKGRKDIQSVMKMGKYLRRYTDLDDNDIKTIANEFTAKYGDLELQWAEGSDIADVYEMTHNGFTSCMSGEDHDWDYENPCIVYDSPDIKLAYLASGDQLAARALINVKKKQYSVVYGNEQLADILKNEGYTSGDLTGCRLRKVSAGNSGEIYVMPYLDGNCMVSDYGNDYFIVEHDGEYEATGSEGIMYAEVRHECSCCGDLYTEDYLRKDHEDEWVCGACTDYYFKYAYVSAHTKDWVHEHYVTWSDYDNEYFHDDLRDVMYVESGHHGDWIPRDEAVYSEYHKDWLIRDEAMKVELIKVTGEDYVLSDDFDEEEMREAS